MLGPFIIGLYLNSGVNIPIKINYILLVAEDNTRIEAALIVWVYIFHSLTV